MLLMVGIGGEEAYYIQFLVRYRLSYLSLSDQGTLPVISTSDYRTRFSTDSDIFRRSHNMRLNHGGKPIGSWIRDTASTYV